MTPFECNERYEGVITRIAYVAKRREHDHVTVRLSDGELVDTYRFEVSETGPQECEEPSEHFRLTAQ